MAKKFDKKIAAELAQGQGDAAALAWLDGSGNIQDMGPAMAMNAIQAAVLQQNVALLQSLESAPKVLRKAARLGLHKLKSQGVSVQEAAPSRSFGLKSAEIDPDPTALIGPADREGYSEFLLAWTDQVGTCILMGRFGGAEGMRDLSHGHSSRGELRRMLREMSEQVPYMTRMPFDDAMRFVLPAVERVRELSGGVPEGWEVFAGSVPPERLQPSQTAPAPGGKVDTDALQGSSALVNHPWFSLWPVETDLVQKMVGALAQAMEAPESDDPTDNEVTDMTQILSDMAAEGLDNPEIRGEWVRRAAMASVACQARGEDYAAEMAANLHKALLSDVSAAQIPLVERNLQMTLGYMAQQGD